MKKLNKRLFALLLAATTLSSCKPAQVGRNWFVYKEQHGPLLFWSSFGNTYANILKPIVNGVVSDFNSTNPEYPLEVEHEMQGSYGDILKNVSSAIADGTYPNVLQGYPDHFARYLSNDILRPLDVYFDMYEERTGIDLKEDYFEDYMTENMNLDIDQNGKHVITGVPFNKSTELLGYNGVFVDYCKYWVEQNPNVTVGGVKASNWNIGDIPKTWQGAEGWETKGKYYKHIMDTLSKDSDAQKVGKLVYGKQQIDGTAYDFEVIDSTNETPAEKRGERIKLMDFKDIERKDTRVIGWDAADNMFITLLRQWGANYTSLPETELSKLPKKRVGHVLFNSSENRAKVIECLRYFCKMNNDGIFGTPLQFNDTFCSNAYYNNKIMFMVCSSGGFEHSTEKWNCRLRVSPLPYYNDGTTVRKFVISQGANIAVSKLWGGDDAFNLIVGLTTGERQGEWCAKTGYFPASKSAQNSEAYKALLNKVEEDPEHAYDEHDKVAFREGAILNETYYMEPDQDDEAAKAASHYMDDGVGWTKFVDAAFSSSSTVREKVASVFPNLFSIVNSTNINSDEYFIQELNRATSGFDNDPNILIER